ncbi:thioredoxin [Streptomyces globosus]|uniref:Thioredoxin n=1 Tax=Streptomyces globosus TaxID=68209 RepID=A0A344U2L9_9ACTN|nr:MULTISPECIES: thioredoxin family protein [Streptomyces]AXE25140.1 thioredoxin [Streptomyces globosus]
MAHRVHRPAEDEEFAFVLRMAEGPVLACFVGSWPKALAASREMDALAAEAAAEYGPRLTAVRADMARCPGPTRRFGVTSAPTALILRDGREAARYEGPAAPEEFRAFLREHLGAP